MTAQIIHIDPEIETAIRDGKLSEIEITEAHMRLSNGALLLRARDLLPQKIKADEEKAQAKTPKQRQRDFVKRKNEAGFKKDWVHQSIQELAEAVGGQENIASCLQQLRKRAEIAEQRAEVAEAEIQRMKSKRGWLSTIRRMLK
ncbi:hypothetical protein [Celeribacter sp. PS-C1]|uniref:hypothetical protein n=1 Tax=Celeribacter sp. PS-C1 TaxID=2820813 RepID=UPI001CA52A22|nr:hypothetical protein [Celeribacter sp. PS-C1]MBW6419344.1 hypothetical protein [Celeribacter sp. PS-C1]